MAELDGLIARLDALSRSIPEIARATAPLIQARLRQDATTKRGNVPSFGPPGNVPIVATAAGNVVEITAPDWVLQKAIERGQVSAWIEIAEAQTARLLGK